MGDKTGCHQRQKFFLPVCMCGGVVQVKCWKIATTVELEEFGVKISQLNKARTCYYLLLTVVLNLLISPK